MEIGRLDARFGVEVTGLDLSRPLDRRHPLEDSHTVSSPTTWCCAFAASPSSGRRCSCAAVENLGRPMAPVTRDLAPAGVRRGRGADQSRHRQAHRRQRTPEAWRILAHPITPTWRCRRKRPSLYAIEVPAAGGQHRVHQSLPRLRCPRRRDQGDDSRPPGLPRLSVAPRTAKAPDPHEGGGERQLRVLAAPGAQASGERPVGPVPQPHALRRGRRPGPRRGRRAARPPLRALRSASGSNTATAGGPATC